MGSDLTRAAAVLIFLVTYAVLAVGRLPGFRIDRPAAAFLGAALMVAFGGLGLAEAWRAIDMDTLALLLGMMVVVAALTRAGAFRLVVGWAVTRARHPLLLLAAIVLASGVLSAFLVNDTVCLVLTPLVLDLVARLRRRPVPYLLAIAMAANVGSTATITGNPQNMLIGSFSGLSYRDFLLHLGPVALIGMLLDWLVIRLLCGAPHGAAAAAPAEPPHMHLRELRKPAIVIALVLAGFLSGVPPAMMAALGAALMLITRTREPRLVYDEVDWGLLVFFVGLFLIVGGAERAGLTDDLATIAARLNLQNAGILTGLTALLSNIVSNVPAVMLLKSLVPSFHNPRTGWMVLAMASTLAGNLTITGSVANLIVVERARDEAHIGFWDYSRVGIPVTLLTLAVGWAWLGLVQ